MVKRTSKPDRSNPKDPLATPPSQPRIIGGLLRGRKLAYSGDERTRPMKDRVREAVFNLVGPDVVGIHALDLFAGTGALGFEALSRGAKAATFVEQHFPTAALIRRTATELGLTDVCQVAGANTFIWSQRDLPSGDTPWLVFVSPPWSFFSDRAADMTDLIERMRQHSPPGSVHVIEADAVFDFSVVPQAEEWDVRHYPPAVVGIWRKT